LKKEQLIKLADKYSKNNCTEAEKEVVEIFFQKLQKKGKDLPIDLSVEKRDELFLKITTEINSSNFRIRKLFYKASKIAAVAVLFISIPIVTIFYGIGKNETINQMTAKSEIKNILLPDGSQVILNANSSISYSENFKQNRKLKLTGEAFFKVVKNPKQPFVVETSKFKTKVLGTSFNVKAYPNTINTVSVVTGKVEVSSKENSAYKSILIKNQRLSYNNLEVPQLSIADAKDFNAWTKKILIFQNASLKETALTLENQFNVTILFEKRELEDLRITGKFKEENLNNILNSIALVKQLEIQFLTKNKIYVREKE
jgi:ferric-dicitrate binding protein FerR (iron transport regulator)